MHYHSLPHAASYFVLPFCTATMSVFFFLTTAMHMVKHMVQVHTSCVWPSPPPGLAGSHGAGGVALSPALPACSSELRHVVTTPLWPHHLMHVRPTTAHHLESDLSLPSSSLVLLLPTQHRHGGNLLHCWLVPLQLQQSLELENVSSHKSPAYPFIDISFHAATTITRGKKINLHNKASANFVTTSKRSCAWTTHPAFPWPLRTSATTTCIPKNVFYIDYHKNLIFY